MPRVRFPLRPTPASPCRFNTVVGGLRELGSVEGHTIVIEWRCGDGTPERARALALELVQLPVDRQAGVHNGSHTLESSTL